MTIRHVSHAAKSYSQAYHLLCDRHTDIQHMTLSVKLDPALEARIDAEARRLGISKSEFVNDALERVLGVRNPAKLLRAVRSRTQTGKPDASENVSRKVRARLHAKRAA